MNNSDHRFMTPPSLSVSKRHVTTETAKVFVWDLRIAQPNVSHLAMTAIHSIEHFMGSLLPKYSENILNVAPMGCQTGFYIVSINLDDFETMAGYLEKVFVQMQDATEVPLANNQQCGWSENHSLIGAQEIADWLLRRRSEWKTAFMRH